MNDYVHFELIFIFQCKVVLSNLIFKYKSTNENKYQEMQNPKVALKHSRKIALGSLGTMFHREEDKRANRRNPFHNKPKNNRLWKRKAR